MALGKSQDIFASNQDLKSSQNLEKSLEVLSKKSVAVLPIVRSEVQTPQQELLYIPFVAAVVQPVVAAASLPVISVVSAPVVSNANA